MRCRMLTSLLAEAVRRLVHRKDSVDAENRTWYVTRSLFLGGLPGLPGAEQVTDAAQAADVIMAGGIAVLPAGAWDMADEVLWLLDLSREWREHLLHWARTGKIAVPVPAVSHPAEPPPRRPTTSSAAGPWPDPPDGAKAGPMEVLAAELATLEQENDFRHAAVLRLAEMAVEQGMHPDDALRRALDETAADDEMFDNMLAERLSMVVGGADGFRHEEDSEPDGDV